MTSVTFLSPGGESATVVDVAMGESVMQAAVAANVKGIEAECGGCLTCATCHVYVDGDDLSRIPPPSADELAMLEFVAAERRPNSRLSCQIVATAALDRLLVQLPDRQVP